MELNQDRIQMIDDNPELFVDMLRNVTELSVNEDWELSIGFIEEPSTEEAKFTALYWITFIEEGKQTGRGYMFMAMALNEILQSFQRDAFGDEE